MARALRPVSLLGVLLAVGGLSRPAQATHTTFSYTAAVFELSGDQGSVYDDFSDGVLAPWVQGSGTATDSGSGLILSDPGTDISLTSPFWAFPESRDVSSAFLGLGLADAAGDFLMESRWTSGAPLENQLFAMALFTGNRYLNLVVMNVSEELGARATHPLDAGIYAWFQNATTISPVPNVVLSLDPDPASSGHLLPITDPFTGDVILRINFDKASDLFFGSFSLDGGGSFNEGLSAHAFADGWSNGGVSLAADPFQVVPEPSGALLVALGLLGMGVQRRQTI